MRIQILALLLLAIGSVADNTEHSTLFNFLTHTYDAQSMGRAGISTIGNGDKGRYVQGNPALAAELDIANFAIGYQPYAFKTHTGFLGGAAKLSSGVVLAPLLNYITYGVEEPLDSLGNELEGAIAPYAFSLGFSAAYQWDEMLFVGGTFRVAHEKLTSAIDVVDEAKATAFLFDLGMMYRVRKFTAASGIRNIGFWTGYESVYADDWKLPTTVFVSMLWSFPSKVPVDIFFETEKLITSSLLFKGAFEFSFRRDVLALRFGSALSLEEIRNLGNLFSGSKNVYEQSKQNWQVFSFGLNVAVPVNQREMFFDIAMGLRADGIEPQFAFSGGLDF